MRILYVTSEDMCKEGGGRTHFFEVAKHLKELEHELLMLLPGYRRERRQRTCLFEIKYVPTLQKNLISYLLYEMINVLYLTYQILKFRPEVIYSRQCLFDFMHALVSKVFGVPYVMEKNGIMEHEFRQKGVNTFLISLLKLSELVNLRLASAVVCVTKGIKQQLSRLYDIDPEKMVVIPNGVDPEIFKPLRKDQCLAALGLRENKFYLGFCGTLAPWQGVNILLEAASLLCSKYPQLSYLIVGDGEGFQQLKDKAKSSGIEDMVYFFGRVPHAKIPLYINCCDVVVVPKTSTNRVTGMSPLKLYEYLSCGKAVISSNIDGLTEVVREADCGLIFEADDALDLSLKIEQAYQNSHLLEKMGERGRTHVRANYTWQATASKIGILLEEVCFAETRNGTGN